MGGWACLTLASGGVVELTLFDYDPFSLVRQRVKDFFLKDISFKSNKPDIIASVKIQRRKMSEKAKA